VNVVANGQPLRGGSRSTVGSDVALEVVLGVLDLVDVVLVVVVGVNVEVSDVVTEISHVLFAARLSCAAGVRRAHVGGDLADDVAKSHLVLPHLVLAVNGRDSAQVQVGPGVGCDVVALRLHALDNAGELRGGVDLALVDVVAGDEESSLSVVCLEDIKDVSGVVLLWAIVVGQSNCARGDTVVDTRATVRNGANLGAGNRRGVCTSGGDVLRATGAVRVVAARGVAVIILGTAVCLLSVRDFSGSTVKKHTSSTRAALSGRAVANSSATLTVVLAGSQAVLVSVGNLDLSNAGLKIGEQVTGLEVTHVDTSNLGQSHTAMGTDEWGDGRNGGECREVHVVERFVFVLRDY